MSAHGGERRPERAAGAHQSGGAIEDVPAEHVEHHVDLAGVLQPVRLDERVQAFGSKRRPGKTIIRVTEEPGQAGQVTGF
ncbi:hypothetical protein [Amycolatopsis sp. NPDC051372]|uniref:hypothetical protein n=1 Tax=unclassified Amycolatopsis TaxID=2618356 RepID=UPI00342DCEC7